MEKDVMKRALVAHAKMQKSLYERDKRLLSMPVLPTVRKLDIREKNDTTINNVAVDHGKNTIN